jgi:hypothetical protein
MTIVTTLLRLMRMNAFGAKSPAAGGPAGVCAPASGRRKPRRMPVAPTPRNARRETR